VLPLSLFMLMVVALLVALLLEGALQELRTSRGDLAGRPGRRGTALADFFAVGADGALLPRAGVPPPAPGRARDDARPLRPWAAGWCA
jgi:hypothetical protein